MSHTVNDSYHLLSESMGVSQTPASELIWMLPHYLLIGNERKTIEENGNQTLLFSDVQLPSNNSYMHQHSSNDSLNGEN